MLGIITSLTRVTNEMLSLVIYLCYEGGDIAEKIKIHKPLLSAMIATSITQ